MKIALTGRHMEVGPSLRQHVESRLSENVEKYFDHAIEASVVVAPDASLVRADISVHAGRGIQLQGHGASDDALVAFDRALERISKRLRRYKRRLRDHHRKTGIGRREDALRAQQYILAGPEEQPEDDSEEARPVVIAEVTTEIETMTVSEAIMRLDLAEQTAVVFRNAAHGELNVVYRRSDGNLGWVDPIGNDRAKGPAQGV